MTSLHTHNRGRAAIRWRGLQVFDREILADKARVLLRHGESAETVARAIGYRSTTTLRVLARDFDFAIPDDRPNNWPKRGDPGDPTPSYRPKTKTLRVAKTREESGRPVPPMLVIDPPRTSGSEIITDVCLRHGLTRAELTGGCRAARYVAARQEAAFRMVVRAGYTYAKAARLLGYRDHTTAYHAVGRVAASTPELSAELTAYHQRRAEAEDLRRDRAIHLHFEEGRSAKYLSKVLAVSYAKLVRWLTAEADRRRLVA